MIESFKSFARKSPLVAGCVIGGVVVWVLFLLGSLLTGPKTEFGSAATILKEDYLRLAIDEFARSGDGARARWRYERLGSEGSGLLTLLKNDPLTDPATLLNFARTVGDDVLISTESATPRSEGGGFPVIGLILALLVLILAAGFAYLFLTDPKRKSLADALRTRLEEVISRFNPGSAPRGERRADPSEPSINYRESPFKLRDYPPTPSAAAQDYPATRNTASVGADKPEPGGSSLPAASSLEPAGGTRAFASQSAAEPEAGVSAAFFQGVREERRIASRSDDDPLPSAPDIPAFLRGDEAAHPEPESVNAASDVPEIRPEDRRSANDDQEKPEHGSFAFYEPPRPVLADGLEPDPEPAGETGAESLPDYNDQLDDGGIDADDNRTADEESFDDILSGADAVNGDEPLAADTPFEGKMDGEFSPWEDAPAEPEMSGTIEPEDGNRARGAANWRESAPETKSEPVGLMSALSANDELQRHGGESLTEPVPEPIHVVRSDNLNLPLVHYKAVYRLGDDLFDETFSIDEMDDEFIGECGIGIAETINSTEPKAVTAFEAWLFDRQDTMTPTFFMLSEYAYQHPEMLERLKNKGQYGLMEVGQSYVIETFALKMTLKILEIVYGTESSDPKSYFDRVVFDVEVVRR